MSALTDEFESKLNRVYSHLPYDDSMRHWSGTCLGDDTPMLQALTEDPRFVGPAKQMYGDDVLLAGVDGVIAIVAVSATRAVGVEAIAVDVLAARIL